MSTGFVARRVITFALIATLIPAPGLAWRAPVFHRPGADTAISLIAQRVFAEALNTPYQVGGAAAGRPQIYLVYAVDLAVPSATPPAVMTAASLGWFEDFLAELAKAPATGAATATATPTDSILDDIDASDAHIRSMETARALASMPTSLPFEANPNESVSVERSMSVAIKDALQEAGVDNPDNNGRARINPGTGTVTYEGEFTDGDIVVTGRLVDGRIVLTSEFKPLTNSGDVGEPVRIRGTSTQTPTTAVQTATIAEAPVAAQTPAKPQPSYNDTLRLHLEQTVKTITPNQTNSVVMGQVHVRDTYVVQVNSMADNIEGLLKDPAQLDALTRGLRQDAEAVDSAYQNMLGAERNVATVQGQNPRVDLKHVYETDIRRAEALEAQGDKAGADQIRQAANNTVYGNFIEKQRIFFATLDQNPLLGLGERGWFLFPDDFLFKALRNTLSYNAPNSEYVTIVSGYLQTALDEAREEATRAAGVNTVEDLTEFGSPKYERTRQTMAAEGQANGSTLPGALADAAEGHYEMVEGGKAVTTEITNFGLNLVAGSAWVIPGIGPFIAGGAAAIQVVREGNDLYIAVLDAEDARNLAGVTGYTRVITAEDRVAAERGEFGIAVVGLAFEGLTAVKIVQGPLPSGVGNTAADASTAAVRSAPSPGATAAQGAPPAATVTPPRTGTAVRNTDPKTQGADGVWDPAVKVPGTEAEIAAAFKREMDSGARVDAAQDVRTEIQLATEAGVDGQLIKDITKNFDPNGSALGNRMMADELMKLRLKAQGYDIDMPREDFVRLQAMSVRAGPNGTGLTPDDIAWLNSRADAGYFDKLPQRGFVTGFSQNPFAGGGSGMPTEGFVAALDAESAAQLQAAWKGSGGQYTGAAAAADDTGTVILRPGSQPQIADPNKTVLLDPNKTALLDPNKTALMDPNKTALLDPNRTALMDPSNATPTVRLDPNDTTPTVRLDPNDATPTVRLDPNDATPTVRLDPNRTTMMDPNKTALIDPNKTTTMDPNKTALMDPNNPNPTVRLDPNKTALIDPNATTRMADELTQSLPKAQQRGLSPRQFARTVRPAMRRAGVRPDQLATILTRRLLSPPAPRPVSMAELGTPTQVTPGQGLAVSLEALGVSSGVAFNVRAINHYRQPVALQGQGVVVEPVPGGGTALTAAPSSTTQPVTQPVEAFCLERERPVATAGTQYRVAPPAAQAQHRRLVDVLDAAQRVSAAGLLKPDSEVKGYFNFVRQWSIWTRQERFDEKQFTDEFVNQTKKNVEGQGVKWTGDMQATVRKAAPGRWRDITRILEEAK